MSLDVTLEIIVNTGNKDTEIFEMYWSNITHNLNIMAKKAGIYYHCWRPEELGIKKAKELIQPLTDGLERLKKYPFYFESFNSPNGWGLYIHFVPWIEKYLKACKLYPNANVVAGR